MTPPRCWMLARVVHFDGSGQAEATLPSRLATFSQAELPAFADPSVGVSDATPWSHGGRTAVKNVRSVTLLATTDRRRPRTNRRNISAPAWLLSVPSPLPTVLAVALGPVLVTLRGTR